MLYFFSDRKIHKKFFFGGKEMRKFKKIALLCALLMIATIGTTAGAKARERSVANTAVSAEGTESTLATKENIRLDENKFSGNGLTTSAPYIQIRKKSAAAVGTDTAEKMKNPQIAGTLRIGLGGADFSKAEKFRFLLKSTSAARLKFGFIDKSGTAYIIKKQIGASETPDTAVAACITYYNYSLVKIRNTETADLNYTGMRFNETGMWTATYVDISKSAFVNALSYKTGEGVAFGYGYSEGSENDEIDWNNIDSMFIEMVNYVQYQSNVNFYQLQTVYGEGESTVVTKVSDAEDYKQIEKPEYNAENSGYEKGEYSFGTRPALENADLATYFDDCVYAQRQYTLSGGNNGIWAGDGTPQNLTGYNAISYYVDNTIDPMTTGTTDWKFVVKGADDKNYYGADTGIRISDDGAAQWYETDVQKIPAGFKGTIVIPFSSFKDGENLLTDTDLTGVKRTLLLVNTADSGVETGNNYRISVRKINYIANFAEYHTAAQKNAVRGAIAAFAESFAMTDGAALRVKKDDYGLRFKVNLSTDAYTALTTAAERTGAKIELGAILSSADSLNGAPLTRENAEMSLIVEKWDEENKSFFATLGYDKIQGKEAVNYTVRGYLTLTFADGSSQTVYTGWSVPENGEKKAGGSISRSLKQVAEAVSLNENFEKEFADKSDAGKAYAQEVLEQILGTANA